MVKWTQRVKVQWWEEVMNKWLRLMSYTRKSTVWTVVHYISYTRSVRSLLRPNRLWRKGLYLGGIYPSTITLSNLNITNFECFQKLTPVDHVNSIHQGLFSNKTWNQEMLFSFYVLLFILSPMQLWLITKLQNLSTVPAWRREVNICLFSLSPLWETLRNLFFSLDLTGARSLLKNNVFPCRV